MAFNSAPQFKRSEHIKKLLNEVELLPDDKKWDLEYFAILYKKADSDSIFLPDLKKGDPVIEIHLPEKQPGNVEENFTESLRRLSALIQQENLQAKYITCLSHTRLLDRLKQFGFKVSIPALNPFQQYQLDQGVSPNIFGLAHIPTEDFLKLNQKPDSEE